MYLCASFRMLGVPSNKVAMLSGATMKTFANLQKNSRSKLIERRREAKVVAEI